MGTNKKKKKPVDKAQQANTAAKAKFKRGRDGRFISGKMEAGENDELITVKGFPDVSWP